MKKVLIISESHPLPEKNGGRQRTMHFVRYFKQFADIDLVYSLSDDNHKTDNDIFRQEICIPYESASSEIHRNILFFMKKLPWCVLSRHDTTFKKYILELIKKEDYDIIFIRYILFGHNLLSLSLSVRRKICLDVDDVWSGSLYNEVHGIVTRHAFKKKIDYQNLVRYEKRCCSRFGKVLFCTQEDLKLVAGEKRANCHVVPNVVRQVAHDSNSKVKKSADCQNLLFVGTLNYKPNVEGICWFVDEIFPKFKETFPEAKLVIVGRRPRKEIMELANRDGIEVYGDVPDVTGYYRDNGVVVVPVLQGGGTRIKILEAALLNRPVLSTKKGAEGLDFEVEKEILLFHDAESFMVQHRKLLSNEFYISVVKKSYKKVKNNYSVDFFNKSMDNILFSYDKKLY